MKFLFLVLFLFSCRENISGSMEVIKDFNLMDGVDLSVGTYPVDLKIRQNKLIAKIGDQKVKVKDLDYSQARGERYTLSDPRLNADFDVLESSELSQAIVTEGFETCSYQREFYYYDTICRNDRRGRRVCQRVLRRAWRTVFGDQRVRRTTQFENRKIDVLLISKDDNESIGSFDSSERIDRSITEILSRCY